MNFNFMSPRDPLSLLRAHRRSASACAVLAVSLGAGSAPHSPALPPLPRNASIVEREAYLMGTRLRVVVATRDEARGIAATEAVFSEARRLERLLSSWRKDSEISRLNSQAPGVAVRVSPELFALLGELAAWVAWSGGAFDPAVGPLVDAWDLRGAGRRPSDLELSQAAALSGLDGFELGESEGTVIRRRPGSWITAGGFGKGAALRAGRRALEDAGVESALLDFGGQLLAIGRPPGGDGWTVGVAHPARRGQPIATLTLVSGSAATSGASERFVRIDGNSVGHILDPRSGRPVSAWGSATVVAADPLIADVAATALFVLGPDEGMEKVRERNDLAVLFLVVEGERIEARCNSAMASHLLKPNDRALNGRMSCAAARCPGDPGIGLADEALVVLGRCPVHLTADEAR